MVKSQSRVVQALRAGLLACVLLGVAACGQENSSDEAEAPVLSLHVGLMPAIDIAPLLIASERGYFLAEGLTLSYDIYPNAQVRQSAIQGGMVDGILTDLVALALSRAGGFPLKATTSTDGIFAMVSHLEQTPVTNEPLSIALMEASVVNFLADLWLGPDRLSKSWVADPGLRLEAVASGAVDAAVVPEPLVARARARGLNILAQTGTNEPSTQVLAFTQNALDKKAEAINAFHRAWDRAVLDLQSDPDLARDALSKNLPNLSTELASTITLPLWDVSRLPDDSWIQEVNDWTAAMSGKDLGFSASDLVDRRFVSN